MRLRTFFGPLLLLVGCVSEAAPTADEGEYGSGGGGGDIANGGSGPAAEPIAFRPHIQADIDSLGCSAASCHGGTSLPMPVVANPSTDVDWTANYDQVKARAGSVSTSPLRDKAMGDGGHIAPLSEGDPIRARWDAWIAQGAPYEVAANTGGSGTGASGSGASGSGASGSGASGSGASGSGASGGGGAGAGGPVEEVTWDADIYDVLVGNACHDCHGTSGWQGAYSVATYGGAMGFGTDGTPNIVPYDETSKLVQYGLAGHHGMSPTDADIIYSWVVDLGAPEN